METIENISEMLKGVLEGVVLEIIHRGEVYGYDIVRKLHAMGFTGVVEGTVYTILIRLEKNRWVDTVKKPSEIGPPRKFYTLNARGEAERESFWTRWHYLAGRIQDLEENINV